MKYKTPEELQQKIALYFAKCEADEEHMTVTGLAMAVDLTRQGLLEYCEKSDEFSDAIKKAKLKIENYVEKKLYGQNVTGCIFNLKNNFGWKDKQETEITGKDGKDLLPSWENMDETGKREIAKRLAFILSSAVKE